MALILKSEYWSTLSFLTLAKIIITTEGNQGSTFPGAQGHMPLDYSVGP